MEEIKINKSLKIERELFIVKKTLKIKFNWRYTDTFFGNRKKYPVSFRSFFILVSDLFL